MSDLSAHARRIAELVGEFESSADEEVRAKVFELLENVDHLHRTAIWTLFERLSELGGKGLVDRIASEPEVQTLFVLYDLIPAEPLVPVSGAEARVSPPLRGGFVPLSQVRGLAAPTYRVAFERKDLPPGAMRAVEIEGTPVLFVSLPDRVFAYRNQCPGTILPLHLGILADGEIRCPWHGCRYAAESGKLLSGGAGIGLESFRVSVDGDTVWVSMDVTAGNAAEALSGGVR